MKLLLVSGHTSGYNKCTTTGVNEGDLNIELVQKIAHLLKDYANVTVYPIERDMYKDNKSGKCVVNYKNFDYVFEVHFNAFNGEAYGSEIILHKSYKGSEDLERTIESEIGKLGFNLRHDKGIVKRNDLMNMNICFKKNVRYSLIETAFYDNVGDMNLYKKNKDKIASIIANSFIKVYELKKSVEEEPQTLYRVQVGAYKRKPNADAMVEKLNGEGYDAYVKTQTTSEGTLYRVQVGAFSKKENATKLHTLLKQKGFATYITT